MLNKIKALADEAIALQNKNRMDEVLRKISALCALQKNAATEKHIADDISELREEKAHHVKFTEEVKPAKGAKNAK